MKKFIFTLIAGLVIAGNASAVPVLDIIDGDTCANYQVTATSYGNADDCVGLLDNAGAGNFNDSESLLNNELRYGNNDGAVIWDANGAFGHNDWVFLGKDDQDGSSYDFINATSGNPATWSIDAELSGTFLIAIKQSTELGFWYFDDLLNVSAGTLLINDIFGDGITNDGWSHVSMYKTPESSVPEPSVIALLSVGLLGLGISRRFRNNT